MTLLVHPKCCNCGHIGNRAFLPDEHGVLRDVISPGVRFDGLGKCSACGATRLEQTIETPTMRVQDR